MEEWSANVKAHRVLWIALQQMRQLSTNFDDSKNLKMSDLLFYNNLVSANLLHSEALIIANQLDAIFQSRRASYAVNVTASEALSRMVNILVNKDKLVKDLAAEVNALYRF